MQAEEERDPWDMPKFPSLKYPNHESVDQLLVDETMIEVEEKLDGANFRFRMTDNGPIFGSRNVLFHDNGEPLPPEECTGAFQHAISYVNRVADFDGLEQPNRFAFYGEALHKHSLDYDAWEGDHPHEGDDAPPNVLLFDAYDCELESWVGRDQFYILVEQLGMSVVPFVERLSATELSSDGVDIPMSVFREPDPEADLEFDQEALAEGVVLRNLSTGQRAKVVSDTFKEVKHGGGHTSPRDQEITDAHRFVDTYVPRARVEKTIYKLVDEGYFDGLKMEMMRKLPKWVIVDAVEENAWELMNNDMEIDEDVKADIRSKVSEKCARVLKNELQSF